MTTLLPVLALGFNALVWGLSWWPLKTLESQGLHPLWATAIIFAVSLACVLLWRPQAWRAKPAVATAERRPARQRR